MTLSPTARRATLTAHVACSVGWLGAVAAFLALAVVGLSSPDAHTVRGVYLVMRPTARLVLVPLAFASLLTGVVQSVVSPWGLVRHYWVIFKLAITLVSTGVLVMYLETFAQLADVASDSTAALSDVRSPSPAVHAGLALVLLLVATALSVFKPRGMTRYGQRKQRALGS